MTSAKTPTTSTKMQTFIAFSFTVFGSNIIRARKFDLQTESNFVTFFDNISCLSRNTYF